MTPQPKRNQDGAVNWAASLGGVVSDVRQALDAAGLDSAGLLDRGQGGYRLNLPVDATGGRGVRVGTKGAGPVPGSQASPYAA